MSSPEYPSIGPIDATTIRPNLTATQPPAAPETDVRLTDAERDYFRGNLRQNLGYRAWVIEDTMLGHVERIVAERVRVVEGERDAARAEVAEVRYELGDALTTLETALMGTPSNGCAWSVVGAPACHAGTREHSFWCRHCLVRSTAALTARAESAEAALRALAGGEQR
jgi:hypothetical protein